MPEAYPDRSNLDTRQSSAAVDALILPHLAEDGREAEYSSLVYIKWSTGRGLAARLRQPYHKGIGDSKHNKDVSSVGSSNGTNFSRSPNIGSDDITQQTQQRTSVVTTAATTPMG